MVRYTPVRATTNATSESTLSLSPNRIALSIALNAGVKKNRLLTRAAECREISNIISITADIESTNTDHNSARSNSALR